MTAGKESFRDALTSLWLRLSTVAIVGLLFLVEMKSPEWLVGWSFYLSASEEVFETIVFAAFTALAGVALGTLFAAVVAPFLFFRKSSKYRIVEIVTRIAVAVAAFIDLASALNLLLQWVHVEGRAKVAVFACYFIAFGLTLRIPRRREQLVTSLENYLGEKTTRRAVFGTGIAAVALIAAEAAMGKTASAPATARRALHRRRDPTSCWLLSTLSARKTCLSTGTAFRLLRTSMNSRAAALYSPISTLPLPLLRRA